MAGNERKLVSVIMLIAIILVFLLFALLKMASLFPFIYPASFIIVAFIYSIVYIFKYKEGLFGKILHLLAIFLTIIFLILFIMGIKGREASDAFFLVLIMALASVSYTHLTLPTTERV